ncbi:MAG: thymidine phosphorylase [Pseudomonadota bacterium]
MTPRDLLQSLRDGHPADPDAVRGFARALGQEHQITDAQAGAFAMGVCHTGLTAPARVALTEGMRDSGTILAWETDRKVIDKHSTGGVGDAVSLMLAPMLACAGGLVPMISGRGLGHTGGTLDKLDAIPSVRTDVSMDRFRSIVDRVGCAIVAPTPELAPADRRLYAIRDVTGTVRSVDLITASILAKKLAAGLDALVLDVKTGTGAVMQDPNQARDLAAALVQVANGAGCPTTAVITDMNQPVLPAIGNAVEIAAVMDAFASRQGRLVDLSLKLGAVLLKSAGVYYTPKGASDALQTVLNDGSAKAKFCEMLTAQGGPENFDDRWADYLTIAPGHPVTADRTGYITGIDGTALGQLVVALGGGRLQDGDAIDHSVGFSDVVSLGQRVTAGAPLAVLHAADDAAVEQAAQAFVISDAPQDGPDLILDQVTA